MSRRNWQERAEVDQPWVIYVYGRSHDRWWPFWSSTRVIGRARIGMECTVCGDRSVVSLKIPRLGPVLEPASGKHPAREKYLAVHSHPLRGHPMSWAQPMRNLNAHPGGLNLDLLAARLEADINARGDEA